MSDKKVLDEELEEVGGGWHQYLVDDGDVQKVWKGKQSNQQLGDHAKGRVLQEGLDIVIPKKPTVLSKINQLIIDDGDDDKK